MLVYTGTKKRFCEDVFNGVIVDEIKKVFDQKLYVINNKSEINSWHNSLNFMSTILEDKEIDEDINVAIEYQIPFTSKRVDFMIAGQDNEGKENIVIVELKQWEKAIRTNKDGIVNTILGGANRNTTHPSYQAYTYAKTIENFNETIREDKISLKPCAYLHNYDISHIDELVNSNYTHYIEEAPLFIKTDNQKLRDFIKKYIRKKDSTNLLYKIENGKIKPSKSLQDAISSMMNGNKEFYMLDEQKVVYSTIKDLIKKANKSDNKSTIIVEGGPGTGKSVVAVNLLADFKHLNLSYVSKNASVRHVLFEKLKGTDYKNSYIKNLFKGSGSFINSRKNEFDCLLVDEAHRLNRKSGLFSHLGENQIKEIINASKVSVFFIDEDQIVTTRDIGTIKEIKYWANKLNSELYEGEEYKLISQFRCNGSDGYIAFLDDMLGIRETANKTLDLDYDIKVFDSPSKMREELKIKNNINNKSRILAGYCYDWKSKKNPENVFDILLKDDFKAKWNFSNTNTWAIDQDSFDQVGCIHTSQGLDFDYVGVIIGNDLRYENNKVITDLNMRSKTDYSLKGIKTSKNYELAEKIIKNTYRTLMTRGQKGCYIYCEDKNLANYIKKRIERR